MEKMCRGENVGRGITLIGNIDLNLLFAGETAHTTHIINNKMSLTHVPLLSSSNKYCKNADYMNSQEN